MKNYYEEKFESLFLKYGSEIAKEKIVQDLLYKSSQPKTESYKNKFDMFWQSNFIKLLTVDEVRKENYILALSQYIRYTITDKNIYINYLKLDIQSFILAVRYSGIILNSEHDSWGILKEISQEFDSEELCGFIQTATHLQLQYKHRLAVYEDIQNKLNISQITAMSFSSLYAYEYLVPNKDFFQLPYQFDPEEKNSAETVWKAFDEIVKFSKKNTKKLTDQSIGLALKNKLMPFLIGEGMTSLLQEQYELYKKLVAIKIEIINYKRNVLESFSFDKQVNYELKNSELIYTNTKDKKDNWSEKNSLLISYWLGIGTKKLLNSDVIYSIINTGHNLEANAVALSKAFAVKEQLEQVYGILDFSINQQKLDAYEIMITMTLSQAHYLKDHIEKFIGFLPHAESNLHALTELTMHGFVIGENRMPFTFARQEDKIKRMSSWVKGSSNTVKKKKMEQILNFWTCDLYSEDHHSTFQQKPFYKIDNFVFQFPWLTAFQNVNTMMINYVRKLHKNRLELKSETDNIELNLAEKFKNAGFNVFCQYQPVDREVGEIDLIAICENHVIVVEVKSTYIKSSIQEIYEYRNFTLNKAAYQLSKKVEFVKNGFLNQFFENLDDVKIHSWIIDTTLEFDHEYFGDHLKVSLDEVIITSNCESEFMQKLVDEQFDIEKDEVKIDPIQFLESIEKNTFWSKQLDNYDHYMEKMLSRLAS
ncbi:NERD domain-containing protein [Acinetobacter johnsonii]|uniref:NERD domain-containing protein n=1 Tax=Acinetobacter johnsonii TaxID=40214 RepID=UPI00244B5259|nr:NERD domain-containing protein [Acinetobacter johnsonii]MDH1704612.1 YraN family protein [Acinetobacter johnsonii]